MLILFLLSFILLSHSAMAAIRTVLDMFSLCIRCSINLDPCIIVVISGWTIKKHPSTRKTRMRTSYNYNFLQVLFFNHFHCANVSVASQKVIASYNFTGIQSREPIKKFWMDTLYTTITNNDCFRSKANNLISIYDSFNLSIFINFKLLSPNFGKNLTILHQLNANSLV